MCRKSWVILSALVLVLSFSPRSGRSAGESKLTVPDILDASALQNGSNGKPATDPCQNFYQFSCGRWLQESEIPADKNYINHQMTALMDRTDESLNQLLLKIEKGDISLKTSAATQLVDFYNSCMGYSKSTPAALALFKSKSVEIGGISSKKELAQHLARLQLNGTNVFFSFSSGQDLKDSNAVIGFLDQGGMGLPEPSFYLDSDKKSVETRSKYLIHIQKLLSLIGQTAALAAKNAKMILALETELATQAYSFDDRQNPSKINHPVTREELAKLSPAIDWAAYFSQLSVPPAALNVNEPGFFSHLSEVIEKAQLSDIKTYLIWQLAHRSASALGPAFDQEDFSFWQKYLHGQRKLKPRWKRCTQAVEHKLGYALAEVYVRTIDTVAIRAKIGSMIDSIKEVFRDDLNKLSAGKDGWLDSKTKAEAMKKLDLLGRKLGAPEEWRDYASLKTDRTSYLSNDFKAVEFEGRRDLNKIGKPVNRKEWDMMPWEINAYYDPPKNEFVFPFGILQPPSFDLKASDGANLGVFGGGTIGHELTHGYDNDGRQYDANGNVRDWWTEETKRRFTEKTECFIHQANHYKIEEAGLNVDGTKSLTENLADQGGVKLGYAALLLAQTKRPKAPLWLGKYNENQQFWISYAQGWCTKSRPETLRMLIKTNPHPPEEFRVNGIVMNRPEFADDFGCKAGDAMAPINRCSIW